MMEVIKKARITPEHSLDVLSQLEVTRLCQSSNTPMYDNFRRCALAVLNTNSPTDNTEEILNTYKDFSIRVIQQERGIKLELHNAPAKAFVDGNMISGIKEHLFSALRDLIYIDYELKSQDINFESSKAITNGVFHIARNAGLLTANYQVNLVVCWGGHSINPDEYQYTKHVGYEMGLRGLDICTGCGPGAMKGPMKGATIGHAKQRINGRYIGITEPGIIAAESPNPIVNKLVIMPDMEKRLEAFVRTGHGIVVFPGGAGTAEEILYLLGILLDKENQGIHFPLVFTGPKSAEDYFLQIDAFIAATLGEKAQALYKIIVDDPNACAVYMKESMDKVKAFRRKAQDAYYFNWLLKIEEDFQTPFIPTHEKIRQLDLSHTLAPQQLAANLRKTFSAIVDGNVKEHGIKAVAKHGPYEIHGEENIIKPLDALLRSFVQQNRMKIPTSEYVPCYRIAR